MKTFLTSDTHFNHTNIIRYCNRPFHNLHDMNESIIRKWNEVVSKDDLVYHLGDVGLGNNEELKVIVDRLNGTKILLKGNHDLRRSNHHWQEIGFKEVYKKEIRLGKYVLTHRPSVVEKGLINIFGHIHDKDLEDNYNKDQHINVSTDVTDFTPVEFNKEQGIIK